MADREVAAGSVSIGDLDLASAARSGQPCPTHATRPGSAKTLALDNNIYIPPNGIRRVEDCFAFNKRLYSDVRITFHSYSLMQFSPLAKFHERVIYK